MSFVRQVKKMVTAKLAEWRRSVRSQARSMSGAKAGKRMAMSIFKPIDVDALRDQIEPAEGGTKLGKNNQPSPDARILSSVENSIIHKVELGKDRNHQILLDQLAWQYKRLSYEPQIGRGMQIEADFNFLVERDMEGMRMLRTEKEEKEDHFENFKKDNNLKRPPNYLDSEVKYGHIAFLLFIFFFETMMNSYFLARGNEFGILGAYAESLLITFLNVAVPVILVRESLFGNMLHVNPIRKIGGCLISISYAFFTFFLNLGVAHYRETSRQIFNKRATSQPLEFFESLSRAGSDAWTAMISQPFGIQEFQAWALFCMGIIFSIVALLDAFKLYDPYPGYGVYHKRLEKIRKSYLTNRINLITNLQNKLKKGYDEIESMDNKAKDLRVERQYILTTRDHLFSSFVLVVGQLQTAAKILIGEFREANMIARTDEKTPLYFDGHQWEIETPNIDRELPDTMISDARIEEIIQKNRKQLEIVLQSMRVKFDQILMELKASRDVESS